MRKLLVFIAMLFMAHTMHAVTASFSANITQGCAPLNVQFSNTSIGAHTYLWYFDDFLTSTQTNPAHTFFQGGRDYEVWLYAYDTLLNDVDSFTLTINVPDYTPYFNAPAVLCPGEVMGLNMFGINDPTALASWELGDGNSILYSNYAQYSYTDTGTFAIVMTVNSTNCGVVTDTNWVTVSASIVPPIHVHSYGTGTTICPGENFPFFYDEILSIHWDFGDGFSSTDPYPTHSYAAVGNYTATITVTNACGVTNSIDTLISVMDNVVPNAFIFASGQAACPGESIHFWGNHGFGFTYNWTFDDGTTDVGEHVYHSFTNTGAHLVELVVTNACGNTDTATYTYNIQDDLVPFSVMNVFSSPACPGDTIRFFASQGLLNYAWDFGDGFTSNTVFTSHAYANGGSFPVTLTVSNTCGNDSTYTYQVEVDTTLSPNIVLNAGQGGFCPGDEITFSADANQGLQNYQWDFGDTNTSTAAYPVHSYSDTGSYTVQLIAENYCGVADTAFIVISSDSLANPFVDFDVSPGFSSCPGVPVSFTNLSSDTSSVFWDFGDGDSSLVSNPVHNYAANGNYLVILTVTNGCGQTGTISRLIQQSNYSLAGADISLNPNLLYCSDDSLLFYNLESGYDSLVWNFNNGFQSTSNSFYLDLDTGSYEAVLTAYNYCGPNADTVQFEVNIAPAFPNASCYMEHDSLFIVWDADVNADSMWISLDGGSSWISTLHLNNQIAMLNLGDSAQTLLLSQTAAGCMSAPFAMNCYLTDVAEDAFEKVRFWVSNTSDEILINANSLDRGSYSISLFDMTGKVQSKTQVAHSGGRFQMLLSTESLARGIYLVRIEDEDSYKTLRLVIGL